MYYWIRRDRSCPPTQCLIYIFIYNWNKDNYVWESTWGSKRRVIFKTSMGWLSSSDSTFYWGSAAVLPGSWQQRWEVAGKDEKRLWSFLRSDSGVEELDCLRTLSCADDGGKHWHTKTQTDGTTQQRLRQMSENPPEQNGWARFGSGSDERDEIGKTPCQASSYIISSQLLSRHQAAHTRVSSFYTARGRGFFFFPPPLSFFKYGATHFMAAHSWHVHRKHKE